MDQITWSPSGPGKNAILSGKIGMEVLWKKLLFVFAGRLREKVDIGLAF